VKAAEKLIRSVFFFSVVHRRIVEDVERVDFRCCFSVWSNSMLLETQIGPDLRHRNSMNGTPGAWEIVHFRSGFLDAISFVPKVLAGEMLSLEMPVCSD
jgi:hypothetical protein